MKTKREFEHLQFEANGWSLNLTEMHPPGLNIHKKIPPYLLKVPFNQTTWYGVTDYFNLHIKISTVALQSDSSHGIWFSFHTIILTLLFLLSSLLSVFSPLSDSFYLYLSLMQTRSKKRTTTNVAEVPKNRRLHLEWLERNEERMQQ